MLENFLVKLLRFLKTPNAFVEDMVAELKENRMIK
jgi:hypothetical protein